jgi:hypothetical protein
MPELSSAAANPPPASRTEAPDVPEVRLRDVINMVIGIMITVMPWFNGDDGFSHGAIRLRFVAACICGLSLWIILHQQDVKAEVMNTALGIALITSPLWRGGIDPYRVNMAIAGAIVAAFSASCVIRILRERRVKQTFDRGYQVKHRPSLN